jgi:hypothetical protein
MRRTSLTRPTHPQTSSADLTLATAGAISVGVPNVSGDGDSGGQFKVRQNHRGGLRLPPGAVSAIDRGRLVITGRGKADRGPRRRASLAAAALLATGAAYCAGSASSAAHKGPVSTSCPPASWVLHVGALAVGSSGCSGARMSHPPRVALRPGRTFTVQGKPLTVVGDVVESLGDQHGGARVRRHGIARLVRSDATSCLQTHWHPPVCPIFVIDAGPRH